MGCVGFALLQARGNGVTKDEAKAQATLNQLCAGNVLEACTQLAILVVPGGRRRFGPWARALDEGV